MKLRTAFVLSLLGVMAVMTLPALHGVGRIQEMRGIALDLRERAATTALEIGRLQTTLARLDRFHRSYVATADAGLGERAFGAVDSLAAQMRRIGAAGFQAELEAARLPYADIRAALDGTRRLVEGGRLEDATTHVSTTFQPLLEDAEAAVRDLAAAMDRSTLERTRQAESLAADALRASLIALLFALIGAAVLTFVAARVLTRPIGRLASAMERVADGAFEAPNDLPYDRGNELGVLARAFRAMAQRLADLDRMKAELVGLASHDLKTPVNVIAGYAEMIDDEVGSGLEPRQRRLVRSLREQTTTLGRRLDQLLEISRLEASGLDLGLEEINLRHFATGLHKTHAPAAARHGIRFRVVVEDTAPSFFIADPDCLLDDVFRNILENSFRFTPRGGEIDVRVSGHGAVIEIEIRDDGTSIAPDQLPYAFDRYYQGPPGRIGNGPGLPIARAAVLAHGGELALACPSDGGMLFKISLPLHGAPRKAHA